MHTQGYCQCSPHKLPRNVTWHVPVQWVGWIKDYDGGTLMECVINARLPYTDFPGLVEKQREALDRHIRTLSKSHVVHPGISSFESGRIDVGSIPGESAAPIACWHACMLCPLSIFCLRLCHGIIKATCASGRGHTPSCLSQARPLAADGP